MMRKYELYDDGLLILLFHGVIEKQTCDIRNYNRKHIEKDYFASILKTLKNDGIPLSMNEVRELHDRGQAYPARSFAVTFDDGFENNISIAAPILCDLEVPATFYVTSGFIEFNGMSWIDSIEFVLEQVPRGRVKLPWHDDVTTFSSKESRMGLLEMIRSTVKKSPDIDTTALVRDISAQLGHEPVFASNHPLDLKMNWSQVRELSSEGLFEVGGHSHSHQIRSFLSEQDLKADLDMSIGLLKDRADIESVHYAYPEGLAHCYSSLVISELKNRGIQCCPSAIAGKNTIEYDLFNLRRTIIV